jgi:L-ascorbate metabolism protein UlaG (beta-lactamase superfamily)
MLKSLLLFLVCLLLIFCATALIMGRIFSAPGYSGKITDHFNGKTFFNLEKKEAKGFGEAFKWMIRRTPGKWKSYDAPFGEKPPGRIEKGVRITFINHSTFLIQTDGLNVLTDPIWSMRASPLSWAGPRRMRPPGIRFEDLPLIDVVILSHNHYDHLDLPTLKRLFEEHGPKVIAPLGVKRFLDSKGVDGVNDVDWWEDIKLNAAITMHPVPAQHFSGRGMFDRNATLWCGFVMTTSNGSLYFAGDTGYSEKIVREITRRFGAVQVAMLPIGAYKPEWFMSPIHISPEEAAKIHLQLNAETSIAMHFGTFPLADDGQDEPIKALEQARKKYGIQADEFKILREGTSFEIGPTRTVISPIRSLDPGRRFDQKRSILRTSERLISRAFHHDWCNTGKAIKENHKS